MRPAAPSRALPSPTLTPTQALRASFWSRLLMLLAMLITQVLTISVVLWGDRQNAERAVQAEGAEVLDQLARVTGENIQGYVLSATQLIDVNAAHILNGQLDINRSASLGLAFHNMLDGMPQLNGMLLGHEDGRFTFVRRAGQGDAGRFTRVIETQPARRVTTTVVNPQGQVTRWSDPADPYDPRTRPWYRQAMASPGQVILTAPYVFASSQQPGITVARALPDLPDGPIVLGADVQLRNLAVFIKGVQTTPNGRAFVTDSAGRAIATSRAWPVSIEQRVPTLAEVADPALRALLDGQTTPDSGRHAFMVGDQRYLAVVNSVELLPGVRWLVGVYAPASDFSLGLDRSDSLRLTTIGLACLLSSLLAWPLLARAVRPMQRLQHQATTDALTGLRNRASFLAQLDESLNALNAQDDPTRHLGVAIFDLDGFKRINDTYGHPTGDEMLLAVGARMLAAVRSGDILGRLGGDEFALLAEGTSREEVRLRIEGVLAALARRPVVVDALEHPIRSTAGLAFYDPATTLSEAHPRTTLLSRADAALIQGKRREKGRLYVDGESMMSSPFI